MSWKTKRSYKFAILHLDNIIKVTRCCYCCYCPFSSKSPVVIVIVIISSAQMRRKLMASKEKTLLHRILKRNLVIHHFKSPWDIFHDLFSAQSVWRPKGVGCHQGGEVCCKTRSLQHWAENFERWPSWSDKQKCKETWGEVEDRRWGKTSDEKWKPSWHPSSRNSTKISAKDESIDQSIRKFESIYQECPFPDEFQPPTVDPTQPHTACNEETLFSKSGKKWEKIEFQSGTVNFYTETANWSDIWRTLEKKLWINATVFICSTQCVDH